jgi:DNA (cytosine-5)-methyltransferase 1
MRFISLFSGIEAASVASAELNWQAVAFSEIEPFPCKLLAHKYPQTPNLGDITKVDWSAWRGKADIVVGGSPCQAFSISGNRNGLNDERGNLTLEYCKAVHAVKPKYVFWENVPGVLSDKTNAFGCLLAALTGADEPLTAEASDELFYAFTTDKQENTQSWKGAGVAISADADHYSVAWRVLDAQYFGVPQRRRRVFLVGCLGADGWREACEILFECERHAGYFEAMRAQEKRNTKNIKRNAGVCDRTLIENHQQDCRYRELSVAPNISAQAGTGGNNTPFVIAQCSDMRPANVARASSKVAETLMARDRQDAWVAFAGNNGGLIDMPCSETTAPTLCKNQVNQVANNAIVRRMTPIEYERLQGFPENYTLIDETTRDAVRFKALGNSWAIPCVRWIFERIDKVNKGVM